MQLIASWNLFGKKSVNNILLTNMYLIYRVKQSQDSAEIETGCLAGSYDPKIEICLYDAFLIQGSAMSFPPELSILQR